MNKFVLVFIVMGLVSMSHAAILDDFESGLQGWSSGASGTVSLGTNPLTGSQCMVVTAPDTGGNNFTWAAVRNWPAFDPTVGEITLEVSWVASEWTGTSWVNQEFLAINSDGTGGWYQDQAEDPLNPSYPGGWDPVGWGDNTRTLTYDFTTYDLTGSTWGPQLQLSVNFGNGGTIGNYYIDNINQIPEPATMVLLGLGGLLLRRRK